MDAYRDEDGNVAPTPGPVSWRIRKAGVGELRSGDKVDLWRLTFYTTNGPVTTFWTTPDLHEMLGKIRQAISGIVVAQEIPADPGQLA